MNGTYGICKHLDETYMKLNNTCGTMVSRRSANKVVDKFVQGMNQVKYLKHTKYMFALFNESPNSTCTYWQVILKWGKDVEDLWRLHPHSVSRRKALAKLAPGWTDIGDNLGLVSGLVNRQTKNCDFPRTRSPDIWMIL